MANQKITPSGPASADIEVHGRGSLFFPYKLLDSGGQQIDLATRTLFFEVDGVPIREELAPDPSDPLGKMLILERDQVATLKKTALPFTLVDETDIASGRPIVLWEGTIKRTGYVGDPDTVVEA